MTDKATLFPIQVELKILITDGDQDGTIVYSHGLGSVPTDEDIRNAISEGLKAAPDGFRTMDYNECASFVLNEKYGGVVGRVAAPLPEDCVWWDSILPKEKERSHAQESEHVIPLV